MILKQEPTAWVRGAFITQDKAVAEYWLNVGEPLKPLFEAEDQDVRSIGELADAAIEVAAAAKQARIEARRETLCDCLVLVVDSHKKSGSDVLVRIADRIGDMINDLNSTEQ